MDVITVLKERLLYYYYYYLCRKLTVLNGNVNSRLHNLQSFQCQRLANQTYNASSFQDGLFRGKITVKVIKCLCKDMIVTLCQKLSSMGRLTQIEILDTQVD